MPGTLFKKNQCKCQEIFIYMIIWFKTLKTKVELLETWRKVLGLNPLASRGFFCVEVSRRGVYKFSAWSSGFLPQSKDVCVWLTGDSKLVIGVNVSMNGCLSLRVRQANRLSPHESWDGLQPPCDPQLDKWKKTDRWPSLLLPWALHLWSTAPELARGG